MRHLEREFRDYLCEIDARPGERLLPELELAEKFDVSRGDIRKVLTVLCHEGILERRPRAGTVIKDFNAEAVSDDLSFRFQLAGLDPADAFEARRVIEGAILPLVIRRITPSRLSRLRELNREIERFAKSPIDADRADRDFHIELLKACGNETLQAFASVIAGLFHPELRERWHAEESIMRAVKEHDELLDAIKQEDLERATKIVTESLSRY